MTEDKTIIEINSSIGEIKIERKDEYINSGQGQNIISVLPGGKSFIIAEIVAEQLKHLLGKSRDELLKIYSKKFNYEESNEEEDYW